MASNHVAIIKLEDGREVFQSYGVTVAAFIPGRGTVRTDARYSVTTSKHMNQYAGKDAPTIPHEELIRLTAPVSSRQ
jgi:predicted deacetylase